MSDEDDIMGGDEIEALIDETVDIGADMAEETTGGMADGMADALAADIADEQPAVAPPLERAGSNARNRAVFGVPVELVVSVGRARPLVGELLGMTGDTLIPLDARIDDPVELIVGDRVLARGELHEMEDGSGRLAVRLTEIVESVEQP